LNFKTKLKTIILLGLVATTTLSLFFVNAQPTHAGFDIVVPTTFTITSVSGGIGGNKIASDSFFAVQYHFQVAGFQAGLTPPAQMFEPYQDQFFDPTDKASPIQGYFVCMASSAAAVSSCNGRQDPNLIACVESKLCSK